MSIQNNITKFILGPHISRLIKNEKYIFIISLATLLSGCDKFNDIVGRIKEKSPWVYSEETDKLNNSNVFIVKKEFRNKEETVQADVEFQCDSKKVLSLRMKTYTTKQVNGEYPGAAMMFSATADYNESDGIHYIKTRNGDFKIAFPVYMEQGISNSAHIFMTGLKLSGLESIPAVVKMTYATADLKATGYQLAVERAAIPKLFKSKDWVVEIPTENGSIVAEIDLSNQNIQKVFEACSWKPEFSNTVAQAAAPQASAAAQSTDPKSEPVNTKASSTINDSNIVAFVNANLTSEYVAINQPLSLAIRGNLMTADGDFKFLHSYTKTQLPNKLQNVFILCMSSTGIDKLANEATARVLADKFMVTGVSPNGEEFRISADKCEITNPV